MITPIVRPIVRPIVSSNEFPNSFWGSNGRINCSGIYHCEQPVIC